MQFYDLELKQYFWRDKRLIDALFVCVLFMDRAMYIKCILLLYMYEEKEAMLFLYGKRETKFLLHGKRETKFF